MTKLTIAKRKAVSDIRSIWPREPDFSDWLTTAEGIELLAQDCEIEIENPRREAKGTNFSCDVVANLVGNEKHIVVIENQFGRTNHDHLAKLLTYAAVHQAMTGIWIAEDVADDHRQVIDWLNQNTPDSISFFLAELKAYTIGNSPAAPMLDVVSRPNMTMKQEAAGQTEGERRRHEWRLVFWQEIHQHMKAVNLPFRLQRPGSSHWSTIAVGRSGFHLNMLLTPRNQSIAAELVVQPEGWAKAAFEQLRDQEKGIEKELGRSLEWRPMPDKRSSRILLEEKIDPGIEGNRERVCDWFAEWTPKMYRAFQPRVMKLSSPEGEE